MKQQSTRSMTALVVTGALLGLPAAAVANEQCADPGFHLELAAIYADIGATEGYADESDTELGYRGSLSYETESGLFFRTTYFDFSEGVLDGDEDLEISNWDFLIGDTICCGENTAVEIAGGIRYGEFYQYDETDMSGFGPVFSLEAQRTLTDCWSLYAGVKQSFIIGEDDEQEEDNQIYGITEIGAGVQCDLSGLGGTLGGVGDIYLRLGAEGQYYYGAAEDDTQDAALFGGVLTLGFSF